MKHIDNGLLTDPPYAEKIEGIPRQQLEPVYIRNGAIYLTKKEIILNGSFQGENCRAYIMPESRSVNIDTMGDFEFAEWQLQKHQ